LCDYYKYSTVRTRISESDSMFSPLKHSKYYNTLWYVMR